MPRRRIAAICSGLAALVLAPAALAAREAPVAAAPPTGTTVFSGSRLIVQWAAGADHADRVDARDDAGVDFGDDLGNREFQLVEVEPGQTAGDAIHELRTDPAVALAERDAYVALNALPDDPLLDQLWGLRNTGLGIGGFGGALPGADIDASDAWDRTVGTPSTVIADIDSGYRFEHPDLANVAWTNPGEAGGTPNFDDDGNGIEDDVHGADFIGNNGEAPATDGDPTDEDLISGGHGVHTAGTMAAEGDNGVGITGVAQDVSIMPLRVCSRFPALGDSRCAISSIVAAINYAAAGEARAVNMSLGGNTGFQSEVNAIAAATETLFVISAGNDGSDNDGGGSAPHGHHYPCDFTPQTQASPPVPGAIDNIVCVAATDQADGLASFSDWGATSVDLGAPGTETLSTFPTSIRFLDTFEVDDFASKWTASGADGGFGRTSESPLTSFGIADTPGAAPAPNTVRESTSAPFSLPAGLGSCRLTQRRSLSVGSGNAYSYQVLRNGSPVFSSGPVTASGVISTVPITALNAGGEVQIVERYATGSAPAPGNGAWIDDIALKCYEPADSSAATYEFLQGTSMAAPHVTGAAGLLFSLKPTATVAEVRDALLAGVDAVPSLTGKTTSGGRLDVSKAMDSLEGLAVDNVAPAQPTLSGTVPPSGSNDNHPRIVGTAEAGATVDLFKGFACGGAPLATGTAAELADPGIEVTVPDGSLTFFTARATDAARNKSACSAATSYLEDTPGGEVVVEELPPGTVEEALQKVQAANSASTVTRASEPICVVPRLAGKTLRRARVALTVAHCRLGRVTRPRRRARRGSRRRGLVVRSSTPGAGTRPASRVVDVRLGPRPKRKHHRHRRHSHPQHRR